MTESRSYLPAHWLEWNNGTVRTDCYWELPYGVSNHWTLESAEEQLDALLKQSVREHMLSDVPLGVWLSGGVDSSTILHYAAQASSSRLKTFSISFHGRSFDETEYIKRVVEQYGTEHEQLDLNPDVEFAAARSRSSLTTPTSPAPMPALCRYGSCRSFARPARRLP